MVDQPILLVPGLGNSGPQHWQSQWQELMPTAQRVVQTDWDTPDPARWIAALNTAIVMRPRPPLLVGHSLGCALIAHWSVHHHQHVQGALLVAPSDVDSAAHTPDVVRVWSPMPIHTLPFPSIVVASTNDPYVDIRRATFFATAWGSRFVNIGASGHINADSGVGTWTDGQALLQSLGL